MKCCAGFIIRNSQGEYLLQMRDDAPGILDPLTWEFFGGGVEEGEDLKTAAARELEEELGITDARLEPAFSRVMGDTEENLFRLDRAVEWGDFRVLEGAGAGFFTPAEALKIHATGLVKTFFTELSS